MSDEPIKSPLISNTNFTTRKYLFSENRIPLDRLLELVFLQLRTGNFSPLFSYGNDVWLRGRNVRISDIPYCHV